MVFTAAPGALMVYANTSKCIAATNLWHFANLSAAVSWVMSMHLDSHALQLHTPL